jgi:hypothetical protein
MRKSYLYEHLRSRVKKLLPSSRYNQWLEGLDPVQIPLSVRTVRTITTVFEPVDTGFCLTCFEDRADKSSRNPTLMSIFEDWASKSSRLTKSPQTPHYRWERHLPLKSQMSLNLEKIHSQGESNLGLLQPLGNRPFRESP